MNDQPETEPVAKRGAAAYKAEREGIDKRNEQASKRGRQERDAVDRAAIERQRALDRRNDAGLYAS